MDFLKSKKIIEGLKSNVSGLWRQLTRLSTSISNLPDFLDLKKIVESLKSDILGL